MDRVPLRERNRRRVTLRIISAASGLFKTCGYHSTTMDDIAEKAEISRATLFNYFPSKEALLLPWGQEIVEQRDPPPAQQVPEYPADGLAGFSLYVYQNERNPARIPGCYSGVRARSGKGITISGPT